MPSNPNKKSSKPVAKSSSKDVVKKKKKVVNAKPPSNKLVSYLYINGLLGEYSDIRNEEEGTFAGPTDEVLNVYAGKPLRGERPNKIRAMIKIKCDKMLIPIQKLLDKNGLI